MNYKLIIWKIEIRCHACYKCGNCRQILIKSHKLTTKNKKSKMKHYFLFMNLAAQKVWKWKTMWLSAQPTKLSSKNPLQQLCKKNANWKIAIWTREMVEVYTYAFWLIYETVKVIRTITCVENPWPKSVLSFVDASKYCFIQFDVTLAINVDFANEYY